MEQARALGHSSPNTQARKFLFFTKFSVVLLEQVNETTQ